ncbi:Nif3-like dinuclear metal center hexameric protein [Alkalicoccus urumqiensis]|uniref:GTP cyclohydrolase 1 type 2 homolog n=1 Tax=Alkalicoccus urumqiensis TaxID=1548213 RepID=A0A2P6MFQ0_ALKUR|nr:Nif3-like dinuclear metal center hexameric protein [Alkalicoccus urumqiensis]PRO65122.1 Nif3-like dinuclear metal center hexameric protein [Alkalicoccus urumqiensis]
MKPMHVQTIIQEFERRSPKHLAVDGDKIGLQVGSLDKPVNKIMITLDVLEPVVDEAIENDVDFILAHHPLLFRPIKQLNVDTSYGRMIEKLIKHDITVYAAHTNLDAAEGGVNDLMADALGITDTDVLVPVSEDPVFKLVVYVPESHADHVREALGDAGAGHIGNYSHCAFTTEGRGAFRPGEGTDPFIGEQGKLERPEEQKIETVFYGSQRSRIMQVLKKTHPYEEPAFDVYRLETPGRRQGLGRIGYLQEEMTLDAFADHVKKAFGVEGVRVVGDGGRKVRKAAVLGGDGNKYAMEALKQGADVYVTGDLYFHVAHDAWMEGLMMVDPGHHVEKIMKQSVADWMIEAVQSHKKATDVIVSQVHTDPFRFR